jgi:2-methylcitrate dehydratase PrpD
LKPTRVLAEFARRIDLADIPGAVRREAGLVMLDGLGCALAAAGLESGRTMIRAVTGAAGEGPCRIIGRPERTAPPLAAFINAKLGNLMDMDDVWQNIGHQSPVVLYPALAEGEARGAAGADVLAAFIVGFEVASRVVAALGSLFDVKDGRTSPSHLTGFGHAVFGGAAAAGRLAGLDEDRMWQALGIAGLYSPAPLSHKSVMNMSMSKYQLDLAALGAVMAARLAEAGVTGCRTILDDDLYARAMGKTGFWPEFLTDRLGEDWAVAETSLKPYPHCRHTHYALDLLARLRDEHGLYPGEIRAIKVRGLRNYVVPPWTATRPADPFEVQFSLPAGLALVALGVPPGPAWMDPDLIASEAVRAVAAKVSAEENPDILPAMMAAYPRPVTRLPTAVTVETDRGSFSAEKTHARGDQFEPTERLDEGPVIEKFEINSEAVLAPDRRQRVIDLTLDLERVPDVGSLMDLLSP